MARIQMMIPKETQSFKISRTAMTIMVASFLLGSLLATVTIRNINREQHLMENFLFKEGLTLIRTFEAGARTSLMHHMRGDNPVATLVTETAKTETVAYIRIIDEQGRLIAEAGQWPQTDDRPEVNQILAQDGPLTTLIPKEEVFEIASIFQPLGDHVPEMRMMQERWQQWCKPGWQEEHPQGSGRQLIFVGLHTREFDRARQEDVKHSLIMGALLFLVGCAGFYFLILYQGMRVTQTTLANMELYTENVIESMPAGLITLDRAGRIVSCNTKAEELAGKPFTSLQNESLGVVFPSWPADLYRDRKTWLDIPLDCPQEDGKQIPVKVSVSSLLGQGGKFFGTVLILRDIREIRSMEQQLERSRRLASLGQMAAGIAHEIRNPLGTLRGFAQYFSNQFADDENGREYAGLMISEVDRLNHSISALLQFARPRDPDFQEIDPCDLLTRAGQLLEHDFENGQLELHLDCDRDILLKADPDLLLQVLINLLKNSMAVTPPKGVVELGVRQKENAIRIWVKDSGKGMTEEEQGKMFDPFFTTKKNGTGLGLAVSHQIIEQHHGRFEVESAPDQGTRIDIILTPFKERG